MYLKNYKINIIFFIFSLGLILSFVFVEISFFSNRNKKIALDNSIHIAQRRESSVLDFIHDSDTLLHFIQNSQSFNAYLNSQKNSTQVEELFLTLVKTQQHIMQLRYIDANGNEKIRVNRNKDKTVHAISKDKLQNKSGRYYFKDSLQKPLGKVWFSELDLNHENQKVQVPYTPTLRAILPIEKNGVFNGIVIINYLMNDFLNTFFKNSTYEMILVNGSGEILKHYDSQKDWSAYKSKKLDLYKEYPEHAAAILSQDVVKTDDFVSMKLDTPINNNLILILKLNEEYLSRMFITQIYHYTIIGLIVFLLSLFVNIVISKILKKILIDLDETKKLTHSLDKAQKRIKKYVDLININVITSSTNLRGVIISASEAFCEISGYTKEELIGQTHSIVRHPDSSKDIFKEMWHSITNNIVWKGELKNLKKDGSFYWVDITIYPTYDDQGIKTGYTAIRHDITSKKLLETIAITDALTNIFNRRHFNNTLPKIINSAKRDNGLISFLMIDIDYFKQYNDTYGHHMGDDALKAVAHAIESTLQRADDCCFRLGGEEFGVIFKTKDQEKALKVAAKIKNAVEKLKILHENNLVSEYVTVSIGLVCKNADTIASDVSFYNEADNFLYEAKHKGRNQIYSNVNT